MESSSGSGWYTRISDLWMSVTSGLRTLGSPKHNQAKAYTKLPNPEPLYQNTWVPNIENFVDALVSYLVLVSMKKTDVQWEFWYHEQIIFSYSKDEYPILKHSFFSVLYADMSIMNNLCPCNTSYFFLSTYENMLSKHLFFSFSLRELFQGTVDSDILCTCRYNRQHVWNSVMLCFKEILTIATL